jgi:phospholipid N-methyltransferase
VTTGEQPIRMLDFGCGDGAFTAALLDQVVYPSAVDNVDGLKTGYKGVTTRCVCR